MKHLSLYIVTGTTRGIGKALAEEIAARGHLLFAISRGVEDKIGSGYNFTCDLSQSDQIENTMRRLLHRIPFPDCCDIILINNAGVLTPIGPLDNCSAQQMQTHLQINLLAPLQLMALFIQGTANFEGARRIINISSGAARSPYAGWTLYCSAKAALDMATRCAALEQNMRTNKVAVSAVAPGVVATDMQKQIRQTCEVDFPKRSRFVDLQKSGGLEAPDKIATLLIDLDQEGQFSTGGLFDLRDIVWQDGKPTISSRG